MRNFSKKMFNSTTKINTKAQKVNRLSARDSVLGDKEPLLSQLDTEGTKEIFIFSKINFLLNWFSQSSLLISIYFIYPPKYKLR